MDDATLLELARAAALVGDADHDTLLARALTAGSIEARLLVERSIKTRADCAPVSRSRNSES